MKPHTKSRVEIEKKAQKTAEAFMRRAEERQKREMAARVKRLQRAIAGSQFYDWELTEIERFAFAAYGRTKLRG